MFRWPPDSFNTHHRLTLTCAIFCFLHWKCRHAYRAHFAAFCFIENCNYSFTSQKKISNQSQTTKNDKFSQISKIGHNA